MTQTRISAVVTVGAVGLFIVGAVGGAAVAATPLLFAPAGLSADGAVPAAAPEYPKNDSGLTYGSAADAISPETEPDLILVQATNGKVGYAFKKDIDRVDGTEAIESFKSPEDALAWQERQALLTDADRTIPVFKLDGTTKIGEFIISPNATFEVIKPSD